MKATMICLAAGILVFASAGDASAKERGCGYRLSSLADAKDQLAVAFRRGDGLAKARVNVARAIDRARAEGCIGRRATRSTPVTRFPVDPGRGFRSQFRTGKAFEPRRRVEHRESFERRARFYRGDDRRYRGDHRRYRSDDRRYRKQFDRKYHRRFERRAAWRRYDWLIKRRRAHRLARIELAELRYLHWRFGF